MNLLYYPKIVIPVDEIKKYLLYANKISTIVPESYPFNESQEKDWMEAEKTLSYLEKIGIYEKTVPTKILANHGNSIYLEFEERVRYFQLQNSFKTIEESNYFWQMYISKMDNRTKELLIELKLAQLESENTLTVEPHVAAIYMGLLAEYSSLFNENFYSTITDRSYYNEFVYAPIQNFDKSIKAKFTLCDILPIPNQLVSIDEILEFRNRHSDELIRFQSYLNDFQTDLNDITDLREYREKINKIENNIKIQLSDIATQLKESKVQFYLGSLGKIANAIPAFVEDPSAIKTIATGGLLLISLIEEKKRMNSEIVRNSNVSYLLKGKTHGIIELND